MYEFKTLSGEWFYTSYSPRAIKNFIVLLPREKAGDSKEIEVDKVDFKSFEYVEM